MAEAFAKKSSFHSIQILLNRPAASSSALQSDNMYFQFGV